MPKLVAKIVGVALLLAGVAAAIVHYTVEGNAAQSYATLAVAAALLVAGWTLFDWGAGVSRRWGSGKE